jgi:hypothetical protein
VTGSRRTMPAWVRWPGYLALIAGVSVASIASPSDRESSGGLVVIGLLLAAIGAGLLLVRGSHAAHQAQQAKGAEWSA